MRDNIFDLLKVVAVIIVAYVVVLLMGCASSGLYAMSDEWCARHPGASVNRCRPDPSKATTYCQYGEHPGDAACFDWSQESLKKNDKGCPTAVFIAPGGVLEQCF